jgi:hypothetical protein
VHIENLNSPCKKNSGVIRVERALKGKHGRYQYRVHGYGLEGLSSTQPLLDACRAVLALGADPVQR